jgi:CheY-like chemotaxis protein
MLDRVKVLVVDDDNDSCELATAVLELAGAEVVCASSADKALVALDTFLPDVVVCDVRMPRRDGYDLLKAIHARSPERGGSVPAVAVTANAYEAETHEWQLGEFEELLIKPVENEVLVAAVARMAGRAPKTDTAANS